ncbi:MAG: DNA repair protein RecO [Bacteroidales bacterium]|nr:DNA repair protein RecO [Bacteroidales bacterium]
MVESTKGIVIHYTRYTDSSSIVNLITEERGRQAYLVRGINKGNKGNRSVLFQPLTILSMEASYHHGREVNNMKSCALSYIPSSIPYNIAKSTTAIFLAEVLNISIREEMADVEMFRFIHDSIIAFDTMAGNASLFHITFLAQLTPFLGFGPTLPDHQNPVLFDLGNGVFCDLPPASGLYMNHEQTEIFKTLISSSPAQAGKLELTASQRREMLQQIIMYFSLHIPGFKNLKSLKVLNEVFG